MGIKFSRKRDACLNGAEAAAEPAAAPAEEPENQPGSGPEPDADGLRRQDAAVVKPASPVASLPKDDCVWESREVKGDEEDEEAESEGASGQSVPEGDPATGAQVCPPVAETIKNPAALPVDPDPASETEGHQNGAAVDTHLTSSPALDQLGEPAPGPDPTPASLNPDEELHHKREVTSEPLRELVEAELEGSSQGVGNVADQGGVGRLLEELQLTGSDHISADTDP